MPSSLVSPPVVPEDELRAQQKREFDRLCVAIKLVQRCARLGSIAKSVVVLKRLNSQKTQKAVLAKVQYRSRMWLNAC